MFTIVLNNFAPTVGPMVRYLHLNTYPQNSLLVIRNQSTHMWSIMVVSPVVGTSSYVIKMKIKKFLHAKHEAIKSCKPWTTSYANKLTTYKDKWKTPLVGLVKNMKMSKYWAKKKIARDTYKTNRKKVCTMICLQVTNGDK